MYDKISQLRTMAQRGRQVMERQGRSILTILLRRAWLIVYAAGADSVAILRVVGAQRNFADVLNDLE